jgi:hypothetical protein
VREKREHTDPGNGWEVLGLSGGKRLLVGQAGALASSTGVSGNSEREVQRPLAVGCGCGGGRWARGEAGHTPKGRDGGRFES